MKMTDDYEDEYYEDEDDDGYGAWFDLVVNGWSRSDQRYVDDGDYYYGDEDE
jgi:hypothetical protein